MCAAVIVLAISILAFATPAQAPAPALEIFAGYSLLPADGQDDFPRRTSHGGQIGIARFTARSDRVDLFAHGLIGLIQATPATSSAVSLTAALP